MAWPNGGPWLVVTTSKAASWDVAAAALAAAATSRAAVLRIVGPGAARSAPPAFLQHNLAAYAELRTGGTDPERLDDLVALTQSLCRTHGLVLVGCDLGLLVPIGAGDVSLADFARTVQAPVVVVTDSGPDAAHHTTLLLETLTGRGLPAAVIVLDDESQSLDLDALPVAPAGRIPAGVTDPERFRAEATSWLDPTLHATRGRPAIKPAAATDPTEPDDQAVPDDGAVVALDVAAHKPGRLRHRTVSGKRVVLGLVGVFVALVLIVCALGLYGPRDTTTAESSRYLLLPQSPMTDAPQDPELPEEEFTQEEVEEEFAASDAQPVSDVCPLHAGKIVPTRPSKAVTARVNAAWQRIETWLAKNAPATRADLRKPASLAKIDAMQKRMSVTFPPELVASLLRHDGTSDGAASFTFPPFHSPVPLTGILAEWQLNCDILAEQGDLGDEWWSPDYVLFAAAPDGGGLLVDQRPGGHGRVGESYPEDGTSFEDWPASIAVLLERTATALESGKPYAGYPPRVEDNVLVWGDD
jgi:cell wall assembly regulator SMI1